MPDSTSAGCGNVSTHIPLPYFVRLRVITNEDAPPEIREAHVIAYGLMEAVMAATLQVAGYTEEVMRVESITPDLPIFRLLYGDPEQLLQR